MNDEILSRERIIETAEQVLRRYGPAKATVVDVARALGVSHGAVYRHVASKAELREMVVAAWLARVALPLEQLATQEGAALPHLRLWLDRLIAMKRQLHLEDPELFAAYSTLAKESQHVVVSHRQRLASQAGQIIAKGIANGEFAATDAVKAASALLDATTRFYYASHAAEWSDPAIDDAFEQVWSLLTTGLVTRQRPGNLA